MLMLHSATLQLLVPLEYNEVNINVQSEVFYASGMALKVAPKRPVGKPTFYDGDNDRESD